MKPVYLNFLNNNILYHIGEAESKIKAIRVAYGKIGWDVEHIKSVMKGTHPEGHEIYKVYLKLEERDRVDTTRMTVEQYLLLSEDELFVENLRYAK